jgi:hypothetical protein
MNFFFENQKRAKKLDFFSFERYNKKELDKSKKKHKKPRQMDIREGETKK